MGSFPNIVPGRVLPWLSLEAIEAVNDRNLFAALQLGVTDLEYLYMIDPNIYVAFNS